MTDTVSPTSTRLQREAVLFALSAALLWPFVLVARSALWTSSVGEVWAASTLPPLMLVAAAGWLGTRLAPNAPTLLRRCTGLILLIAPVALAAAWHGVTGSQWPDPAGLGIIAPLGTPTWLTCAALLLAYAGGSLGFAGASAALLRVPRRWVCTAAIAFTIVGSVLAAHQTEVALVVSLVAALALGHVAASRAHRSERSFPRLPDTLLPALTGAAAGLLALSSGSLSVIARHSPDRIVQQGHMLRVLGPVVPLALWIIVLAGGVGLLCAAIAQAIIGLARRRPLTSVAAFAPAAIGIVTGATLLRIVMLMTYNDFRRDGGDPVFYHVTGNLLAHGHGFWDQVTWVQDGRPLASAMHGPVFPMALAFFSRLGGTGYFDHQMASILLGVTQVAAVIALTRLIAGRRAALVAGLLAAAYPNIWITDGTMFVEGLMAFFTTMATWYAYRWHHDHRRRAIVMLGLCIGLAALTRGEAILLVVLLLAPLVLRAKDLARSERWRQLLIGAAVFCAVLMPWMIYNSTRFEVFVPLSTNSNEVLFYANCPDAYIGPSIGFWSFSCQTRYRDEFGDPPGDLAQRSVFWRSLAFTYAREHLSRLPKVVLARVGRQWELFRPWQTIDFAFVENRPKGGVAAGQDMYYAMMLLAIPGTLSLRRRRTLSWPLWTHALAVTLTAAYAYGTLRFRAPFEPILCVLAAIGAVYLFDLARVRWVRRGVGQAATSADEGDLVLPTR
jgi:4-amino-4-deoxy-L-arabinose transferase-like glycosyltransferase